MTDPNRPLQIGLRLSSAGLWAVATGVLLCLSCTLLAGIAAPYTSVWPSMTAKQIALQRLITGGQHGCLAVVAFGLLLGFAGRCSCLAVRADVRIAHPRVLLATILEGSSLLSGAALFWVSMFGTALIGRMPPLIEVTWLLFTGLAGYMSRVQFHLYARSLAEVFVPPLAAEVKAVSRLYLYVPGGFVLALGAAAAGQFLGSKERNGEYEAYGMAFAWLIATAATAFGLFMVWRWDGLLAGLRNGVILTQQQETETADPDDRDAEYRLRYQATHEAG